jgi:hypothetical protein
MSLKAKVIVQCMLTAVVASSMLFLPAGTWKYWQGWIFLGLLMIPMVAASIYFAEHDPQLVERRLQAREKIRALISGLDGREELSVRCRSGS